jgi:hypothetical protein
MEPLPLSEILTQPPFDTWGDSIQLPLFWEGDYVEWSNLPGHELSELEDGEISLVYLEAVWQGRILCYSWVPTDPGWVYEVQRIYSIDGSDYPPQWRYLVPEEWLVKIEKPAPQTSRPAGQVEILASDTDLANVIDVTGNIPPWLLYQVKRQLFQ